MTERNTRRGFLGGLKVLSKSPACALLRTSVGLYTDSIAPGGYERGGPSGVVQRVRPVGYPVALSGYGPTW